MSEEEGAKPSLKRRIYDDIKNDFTNIKDRLSGHARKAEMTE